MNKTFTEVLKDIKPNQEYININENSNLKKINMNLNGNIEFKMLDVTKDLISDKNDKFKLLNKVSFIEAMREYNQGKEIESVLSGNKYKIKKNKHHVNRNGYIYEVDGSMQINEINNLWYING